MNNNVNVINKAGKEIVVTVNSKDGNTQIVIDLASNKIELSTLKAGDVFKMNDVEYIVLEQLNNDITAVIRKNFLEDEMKFDDDNNNWKESSIRKFLNEDYLKKLCESFGENNIVEHTVNLLSLDGLDDYGTSIDKVSLLTIDQYRKYRKVIGENKDTWWWLSTPDSTPSGYGSDDVRCVNSDGSVDFDWCDCSVAVRPFFILKSSIFVSCDSVTCNQ